MLIESVGWRAAWAVLGVMIWALVIPAGAVIMRRRPEDFGLAPDGDQPSAAPRGSVLEPDDVLWTRRQAARTPALWMLILTFGVGSMGLGAMLVHLIPTSPTAVSPLRRRRAGSA